MGDKSPSKHPHKTMKTATIKNKNLMCRMPEDLLAQLEMTAARDDRSCSAQARMIIREWLEADAARELGCGNNTETQKGGER